MLTATILHADGQPSDCFVQLLTQYMQRTDAEETCNKPHSGQAFSVQHSAYIIDAANQKVAALQSLADKACEVGAKSSQQSIVHAFEKAWQVRGRRRDNKLSVVAIGVSPVLVSASLLVSQDRMQIYWNPGMSHNMVISGAQALQHLQKAVKDNPGALKNVKSAAEGRMGTMRSMMQEIQSSLA